MQSFGTLETEEKPSFSTALQNFVGSAPLLFGSNLLFTSAIKSQPLQGDVACIVKKILYANSEVHF